MDTETPCKYNWDDLDVGKIDVNHSEKFFKLYNSGTNEKENESNILNHIHNQLKGENLTKVHFQQPAEQQKQQIKEERRSQNNIETVKTEEVSDDDDNDINKNNVETENEQPTNTVANDDNNPRKIAHIITERRTLRKISNVKDDKIPNVYRYNEIYEKKRQEMINRIEEENRKQRIFHSKPAPKFNKSNDCKTANNKQTEIKATIPITPLVLKKSKECDEKRKKKIEEYEKRMRPRAFTCREPIVLREEPYKPKKQDHAVELKPFNLHVQKRLEERKVFDDKFKKALEEKKKQVSKEEEEKVRREKELVKELRKLTTFKARPNPFKN